MFQRKEYFNEEEKAQLKYVQELYLAGLYKRSTDPANFDNNIACLKQWRTANQIYMRVLIPRLKEKLNNGENGFQQHSIIAFAYSYKTVFSAHKMVKQAVKIVLTDDVREIVKNEFSKEPLITRLNYHAKYRPETITNGHSEVFNTHLVNCSISFLDGSAINIRSLDDEAELTQARQLFESKMLGLTNKQRLGYKMVSKTVLLIFLVNAITGCDSIMITNKDFDSLTADEKRYYLSEKAKQAEGQGQLTGMSGMWSS